MATIAQTTALFVGVAASGVGDALPHPIGNNLTELLRVYELEYDTTGAVVAAMLNCLHGMPGTHPQPVVTANPSVMSVGIPAAGAAVLRDDPLLVAEMDRRAFLEQYLIAIPSAAAWVRDLTACHQVSALNAGNVENYFQALNGTRVRAQAVIRVLNATKNIFPKLVDIHAVRNAFTNIEFIRYHIAYSSTPGLVQRFIDDTVGFTVISAATQATVANAINNYWDRTASDAIPRRIVAMARAYLESINMLPANWYQGIKAKQGVSPILYTRWVQAFVNFSRIQNADAGMTAAADLATLTGVVGGANLMA